MPRVPMLDGPQVAPNTLPMVGLQPAKAANVQDVAGQQAQQLGQAMQSFGGKVGAIAQDMVQEANEARTNDAANRAAKLRTDLQVEASQLSGRNALDRPGGKPLADEYLDKFTQGVRDISADLGNDAQRRAFLGIAQRMGTQLYGALSTHEAQQFAVYQDENAKAAREVAIYQAAQQPADEALFTQSLGAIQQSFAAQVARRGGDDAMYQAGVQKLTDDAYYTRYKAWMQTDPASALANFQTSARRIGPIMRDRIGNELFQAAGPQLAQAATPWVMGPGAAPADRPNLAAQPRGIRNRNPGNIRRSDTPWQGEVPGNDPAYATFATPEQGIRAMGKLLLNYQDGYGLNTVEGIVSRWSPARENDTAAYVASVSRAVGVKPGDAVDLHDPATMGKVVRAMIRVENGEQPYTDAQITAGLNAALGNGRLPAAQSAPDVGRPAWQDPEAKTGNPIIDNLPPNQRARVFQMAHSQASQVMTQERTALQSRVQDAASQYLATGQASNPPRADDFIHAYGQAEGMRRYQDLQDTATLGQDLQQVATAPDAEQAQILADAKPDPNVSEGFAARQRRYEILQKAIDQTQGDRRKDPMAYAMRNPSYGFTPIQGFGPNPDMLQQVLPELAKRAGLMRQVARDYGAHPMLFTDREAAAFGKFLGALEVQDKARVLGEVAQTVTPEAMAAVSSQLKDKSESLAIAASLSGRRETVKHFFSADTQGPDVALLYLQGLDAIEQGRVAIDKTAETGVRAEIYNAIQGVYLTPQGRDAAAQAAYGVYAGLKAQGTDDVGRAVRLATGGVMQYNGGPIAKPFGWDDGKFQDAMALTVPERIKDAGGSVLVGGQRVSAADFAKSLPGRRLRTYGDGTYLVMAGSDVVRNPDGSPYILQVPPDVR